MTTTLLSLGPLAIATRRKAENRPLCQGNQATQTEGNGRSPGFRSEDMLTTWSMPIIPTSLPRGACAPSI
jgi:hypothetical protein